MEIHFATWMFDRYQGEALTKCGARNRLTSFYFVGVEGITSKDFKKYIQTGKQAKKKKKQ